MQASERRGNLAICYYSQRETLAFRFMVHRTRLFGLHLADAMGMDDDACSAYAARLVETYVECHCDDDLIDQVLCDLHDIGIAESRAVLEQQLKRAEAAAEREFYQ